MLAAVAPRQFVAASGNADKYAADADELVALARSAASAAPLVCTEGRPSVAATRLLGLLTVPAHPCGSGPTSTWPCVRIVGTLLTDLGAAPWRFGARD